MIRMLFAMFVTLAGFAAAALWMARGEDAREVVAEIVPDEVRSTVREAAERFDLEQVASRLPGSAPKTDAPVDASAAADAGKPAEPQRMEAIAADDEEEPAEPQQMVAAEAVEERELSPRAEFARDLGAAAEEASGADGGEPAATAATASAPSWGEGAAPPREPDQDEWASLIRRMLAVYHQTRAVE